MPKGGGQRKGQAYQASRGKATSTRIEIRADANDLTKSQAQDVFLMALVRGESVNDSIRAAGRTRATLELWRRSDVPFRRRMDAIRAKQGWVPRPGHYGYSDGSEPPLGEVAELEQRVADDPRSFTFERFSEVYLGQRVFPHAQNIVDLIEHRQPRWTHPSFVYEQGEPDLVLVNVPPEHCATLDTPVLTRDRGWVPMGEVTDDDWLFAPDGVACPVREVWRPEAPVPTFDVVFDSGDVITTDAGHRWVVYPVFAGARRRATPRLMTTEQLASSGGRWRVRVADPLDGPDAAVPMDPYLLGYWLGDGCHDGGRFAVGDGDLDEFLAQLELLGLSSRVARDSRDRSWVVYVHGLRAPLRELGLLGDRDRTLPAAAWSMSFKQRLALLQGLMDADGTITAKDSRARFVQHKERLARDVYRLVASVGLKPHLKHYGDAWEVGFRTGPEPVFRLERKVARQKPWSGTTKAAHRVISAVRPTGREEMVQCVTVLSDGNEYLIGDGLIPTRNAKTTTVTINYVTYRIAMDPDIRVIIVSKTQTLAKKMLLAIRNRLTHAKYRDLIRDYAPVGGFDADSDSWTSEMIYVAGRDVEQKDPTVQAIGIGGSIYGTRADLIIMDDCVDMKNAHQWSDQIDWIEAEVMSRITSDGALLVVGTRLAPKDLYSELPNPERYTDDENPWTVLRMPAVLEFAEDPQQWVTLWPYTNTRERGLRADDQTEDGLWPKWDGPRLAKKRRRVKPATWARVYQQMDFPEDSIFKPEDVKGCTNGSRNVGRIQAGMPHNRPQGMDGLIVLAGLDPATSGHTAATVIGLDMDSKRRYVLDVRNRAKMKPDELRSMIYELTDRYHILEWVIEKNAFQGFLTQDREVNEYLNARGCIIRPHFTGDNKRDPDFGVAAMSTLFSRWQTGDNLIELPSAHMSEGVKALVEQLVTWAPGMSRHIKSDAVMSLWMAELACQRRIEATSYYGARHARNRFLSARDRGRRTVVDLTTMESRRV